MKGIKPSRPKSRVIKVKELWPIQMTSCGWTLIAQTAKMLRIQMMIQRPTYIFKEVGVRSQLEMPMDSKEQEEEKKSNSS
jgi:hypothetical protein